MKKAIAGLAVAAVVAGLLVLGAGPAPAAGLERHEAATAGTDEVQTAVTKGEVETIITVVKAAYSAYQLFAGGDMSVREATRQILNAIYSAKTEIIARIDAIAAAQARACAQDAVLDLENFDSFSRDSQEAFAMAARSCVNLIDSLLASGPDKAAADQLGFALQAVGPIMLIVRSRVGVSNASMVQVLVRSTQAVITQLKPTCSSRLLEGRTQWNCRVYSDHQSGYEPSFTLAERVAAARTSRPVAQAVLPQLSDLQELAGNIVLKKRFRKCRNGLDPGDRLRRRQHADALRQRGDEIDRWGVLPEGATDCPGDCGRIHAGVKLAEDRHDPGRFDEAPTTLARRDAKADRQGVLHR